MSRNINKLNKISSALKASRINTMNKSVLLGATLLTALATPAYSAEEATKAEVSNKKAEVEVIEVRGMRGTMTRSLNEKKNTVAIVDAIAAADFGDLPGLSMSDVIENITSVSGHRGKGSASEMSIRGMGPFLGWATANGRVVPSAGFARSSNFKKFPSDLSDKVVVYKSQQADLVEGGTAGTININSLRALDYGKQKGSFEATGFYNTKAADIDGDNGLGNKLTFSWVDQLRDTAIGDFGYTIGLSRTDSANPEDELNSSSTMYACSMLDANGARIDTDHDGWNKRCYSGDGEVTRGNYDTFKDQDEAGEVFIGEKEWSYRTREEEDTREAVVASFQWQPNERFDINFDSAWSKNNFTDHRHDFGVAAAMEYINTDPDSYEIAEDRRLVKWEGESKMYNKGEIRDELETYFGWGLNVDYIVSNDLTLNVDLSHAKSHRNRRDFQTRIFTKNRVEYAMDASNKLLPALSFIGDDVDFNANDASSWAGGEAKSTRKNDYRYSYMDALRVDIDYALNNDFFSSIKAGVRFSKESLTDDKNSQWSHSSPTDTTSTKEMKTKDTAYTDPIIENCMSAHNNDAYMSNANNAGITNGDGSANSWALLQADCAWPILQGVDGFTDIGRKPQSIDAGDVEVDETIFSAYAMGNIDGELFGLPVTGNVGVRFVKTMVDSVGYISDYTKQIDDSDPDNIRYTLDGDSSTLERFETSNDSINVLPSANITFHLNEEYMLRFAAYKAIAKPDQRNMGAGRTINTSESDENSLDALINYVEGGNPYIEPLESINADISLEWYPSQDTSISAAIYWKEFEANFRKIYTQETITIDGETTDVELRTSGYTADSTTLTGLELAGQHNFADLPYPFNGLGVKASYNYTDSGFSNEDGAFGDSFNELGIQTASSLPGIEDANLFGSSKHTFSGSVYWEIDDLTLRVLYKSRSEYFQPNTGAKANRYVQDINFVDVSVNYKVSDNLSVSLKGINVLDEEQIMRRTNSTVTFVSSTGPKWALSAKYNF
ncbi:TonB-dependent receptor [Colwellia sp. UCD-KL20]|uniref:TonB-dependent receptor n=1 Tax=Colwellia sp. UCD-KL20 TaxID=1917165 RepID=UPI0009711043|nr:TonB-dependent receptor [Colwellia sp. UCD-KL20]